MMKLKMKGTRRSMGTKEDIYQKNYDSLIFFYRES